MPKREGGGEQDSVSLLATHYGTLLVIKQKQLGWLVSIARGNNPSGASGQTTGLPDRLARPFSLCVAPCAHHFLLARPHVI